VRIGRANIDAQRAVNAELDVERVEAAVLVYVTRDMDRVSGPGNGKTLNCGQNDYY